jgi:zinc and cadmium transporter
MIAVDAMTGSFVACLMTGLAGVSAAAFSTPHRLVRHGDSRISFAIGALAGTALLGILPEGWEQAGAAHGVLLLLVLASACWFGLDRIFGCRQSVHVHAEHCYLIAGKQGPSRGRPGRILLAGDFFHSLVDGSLIAAAFSTGAVFGAVATAAIIAHEIPRKCATILMLVHSGRSRGRALYLGTLSSIGVLGGGVAAWASLSSMHNATPLLLWGASAMMIYVVIVELMPIMRSGGHSLMTFKQAGFMLLGLIAISGTHLVL